jgi:protein-S-isoprenylcysteine O-methyltransferase Ste14
MSARWAALVLGIILAAYWARVVRLAIKARRRTGRAANFVPPEPLGRGLRMVWYPVVVAWIVHPFVRAFTTSPQWIVRPLYDVAAVAWLAVIVAAAALAATLVCWKRMGRSWRMGIDPGETTKLVVTGPFAWIRHPIYALSSLLMLASLACLPTPLMIALATVHLIFLQWESRREEHHLTAVHGAEYERYCASTGRFLPRLSRASAPGRSADVL